MAELLENAHNRTAGREAAKFKLWRSAGLLLTYKCNAACEFCYYGCSPQRGGLMEVETAVSCWRGVRELAGDAGKIHITGGEPFLYFERLVEVLRAGREEDLGSCDLVETNGGWAKDKEEAQEKLRVLHDLGVERFKVSCDAFHQEYVDIERARLVGEAAQEVFGPEKALIRWEKYMERPVRMKGVSEQEKEGRYIEAVGDYPVRFTGRAGGRLAELMADIPVEEIRGQNCRRAFLGAKGVHVDPYGNVFSGTCSGIIVGNVKSISLVDMWRAWTPGCNELIETLFGSGPGGLLDRVVEMGYRPADRYAGKCHLCTSVRRFLLEKGVWPEAVGPGECY